MRVPWFFLKNARKPSGFWGKMFIAHMNRGHAALTAWALALLDIKKANKAIDIGCGGGRAVALLAKNYDIDKVYGLDYSDTSVKCSKRRNAKAIKEGKVEIIKGNVSCMPFEEESMDYAVSFESYYYWDNIIEDTKGIHKILKHGGKFMMVAEMYKNESNTISQQQFVEDLQMHNLTLQEFREVFQKSGFQDIRITCHDRKGWICVIGSK